MAQPHQGNEQRTESRISNLTAAMMISVALLFDLVQDFVSIMDFLPIVGVVFATGISWFVTITAVACFAIWFFYHHVNYFMGKKGYRQLFAALASIGIELMPIINMLPAFTMGVVIIISCVRIEDSIGKKNLLSLRERRLVALSKAKTEKEKLSLQKKHAEENRRYAVSLVQGKRYGRDEPSDEVKEAEQKEITDKMNQLGQAGDAYRMIRKFTKTQNEPDWQNRPKDSTEAHNNWLKKQAARRWAQEQRGTMGRLATGEEGPEEAAT
jgi:hypothetical protein